MAIDKRYEDLVACVTNVVNAGFWTTNLLTGKTESVLWKDLIEKAGLGKYYFNDGTDTFVWIKKEKIPDFNKQLIKKSGS